MSIVLNNLSKTFPNGTQALKNVSIKFKKNIITGLIGFNGSGKTTTFHILVNFIEKYKGNISIEGEKFSKKWYKKISYLSAGAEPKNPTKVKTHLISIGKLYGLKRKDITKKINDLAKTIDFTTFLNSPIRSLSKGNQQKIKIIACLLNPNLEYLFLDEPFDGLDPIMVNRIRNIFMSLKNVTIIITSHRMDVVETMCKEFYVLKEGELIDFKKSGDKKIIIAVNKDVVIKSTIKKFPFVSDIETKGNEKLIAIDSIKNFKQVNEILIQSKGYVFSTIKEKKLTDSVFEGYDDDKK